MTRLLLISDSHRDKQTLSKIIRNEQDFDRVIFLGDGIEDVEDAFLSSSKPITFVAGNCDTDYCISSERVIKIENINIFITHGHFYDVKLTFKNVAQAAKSKECSVAFIGHTHIQTDETVDGVSIVNPGSVSFLGNYAIITIDNDKLNVELKGLKN